MDDDTLVEVPSIIDGGQHVTFLVPKQTPDAVKIGGLWFEETGPALHHICRDIFFEGREPQGVQDILDLLHEKLEIAHEASESDTHSFAQKSFITFYADDLVALGQLLATGRAAVRRSRIVASRKGPESSYNVLGRLDHHPLAEADRQALSILQCRRGSVGYPLELFWKTARYIDVAKDAEVLKRHYGSGFIPKLKIDDHLFQIERAPLEEQIEHAIKSDCKGLVWVVRDYIGDGTDVIYLESLTFEEPDKVRDLIGAAHQKLMQQAHEALSRAMQR